MIPIRVPEKFRIIAHRGVSAYAPENTLPAFRLAREMSIDEVELDTQLSTDNVVVLCHDSTLKRYGHGTRVIEELSSVELLSLDMGSWFLPDKFADTPMMKLDQLLADFRDDFVFHIELKGRAIGLPHAVFSLVNERNLIDSSIFTSFSFHQLGRMRELSSTCRLGWLVNSFDDQTLERARDLKLFQLCPRADLVTEELVNRGRSVASEIRVWGVLGTEQEVRVIVNRAIVCGCDGITINWPDWVTH